MLRPDADAGAGFFVKILQVQVPTAEAESDTGSTKVCMRKRGDGSSK